MAQLTIFVPDAVLPRVMAAIRATGVGDPTMTDGAIARLYISNQVRDTVARYEERMAAEQIRNAAEAARVKAWTDTTAVA